MAKKTAEEKLQAQLERANAAYKKLQERFTNKNKTLADLRDNARPSSPSAAETILAADKANAENGAQESSPFSLVKFGLVAGGVAAGIWYYYHSGSK